MFRAIPVANKILDKREHERRKQLHEKKLREIKCSVDQERPATFGVLRNNKKRQQLKEDRIIEIERENRILLDKLTNIMKDKNPSSTQRDFRVRSLNKDFRKRQLMQISIENQYILKRIQEQKSSYDRHSWVESHKQSEGYLKNISQYPFQLHSSTNQSLHPEGTNLRGSLEMENRPQTFDNLKRNTPNTQSQTFYGTKFFESSKGFQSQSVKNLTSGTFSNKVQAEVLPPVQTAKTMLYQSQKHIEFNDYKIEIYVQNKYFKIVAINQDRVEVKMFSCPEKEGEAFLQRFEYNYPEIVERIRFKGNLILIDETSIKKQSFVAKAKLKNFSMNDEDTEPVGNRTIKEEEEMKEMIDMIQENSPGKAQKSSFSKSPIKNPIENTEDNRIQTEEGVEDKEQKPTKFEVDDNKVDIPEADDSLDYKEFQQHADKPEQKQEDQEIKNENENEKLENQAEEQNVGEGNQGGESNQGGEQPEKVESHEN